MKANYFPIFVLIIILLVLVVGFSSNTGFTLAQEGTGPTASYTGRGMSIPGPAGAFQGADGLWMMAGEARQPAKMILGSGGPDNFGYTWNDSVAYSWVDVTSGTDTGMSGGSWGQAVGPIPLPFNFKFYEYSYSNIYISASGYVAFGPEQFWDDQFTFLSQAEPNNVVGPYVTPLTLANSGPANRVYYKSGGASPNRYFAVEWYKVAGMDGNIYTFEVLLYENGDIKFQYQTMTYGNSWFCGSAGIEDSDGMDGLNYLNLCNPYPSNSAVQFFRPPPSARLKVSPHYQGQFTRTGQEASFNLYIRNTGELGTDTYDQMPYSAWNIDLFEADGITPLTDTDGDTVIDTGPVGQGSTVTIVGVVTTPNGASLGDDNEASIYVQSSLDPNKNGDAQFQTAIPAPFGQVLNDHANGAMSLYLAQPAGQVMRKTTADGHNGSTMAVAESSNGFAYFWDKYHWTGSASYSDVEYTLLEKYGGTVLPVTKLTNNAGTTENMRDYHAAVDVAPNGRIGVTWNRYRWRSMGNTTQYNYNILFAILDADGNVIYGPANITNNSTWSEWDELGVSRHFQPRITATDDNRFVLAWFRQRQDPPGSGCSQDCIVDDILYTITGADGSTVKPVTNFTNDIPGWPGYNDPGLTSLNGSRWLVAYSFNAEIHYAVLDSDGTLVKAETGAGNGNNGYYPDAIQLDNGRIVMAWNSWSNTGEIIYAVLDGATYNLISGANQLYNPASQAGESNVSVTDGGNNLAVLTWSDRDFDYRRTLYYALVDSSGALVTDPMIFHQSKENVTTSFNGYGNTTYSWTPSSGVDGVVTFAGSLFGGAPGGTAGVDVRYSNHGASVATNVVMTTTLNADLSYAGDNSGVTPTVNGNNISWSFPDLLLLENREFSIYTSIPVSASIGTKYPVAAALDSDGPEANPADNADGSQVWVSLQSNLPAIIKP